MPDAARRATLISELRSYKDDGELDRYSVPLTR